MSKSVRKDDLRALFARSGNQCAFPECDQSLVLDDDIFCAHICHIEAASKGGPRYNPNQTDDERRSCNNLIVMCRNHHFLIDQYVNEYPASRLKEMKKRHEGKFSEKGYRVSEKLISQLVRESEMYWTKVKRLHAENQPVDIAVPIDCNSNFLNVVKEIHKIIKQIEEDGEMLLASSNALCNDLLSFLRELGYDTKKVEKNFYPSKLCNREWELIQLGLMNIPRRLGVLIRQLEIYYLEEYLKANIDDSAMKKRLTDVKKELEDAARSWLLYD